MSVITGIYWTVNWRINPGSYTAFHFLQVEDVLAEARS
jgi:hypothetical protein